MTISFAEENIKRCCDLETNQQLIHLIHTTVERRTFSDLDFIKHALWAHNRVNAQLSIPHIKLNFTSGDSFCSPCCCNVASVLPQGGPLKAETLWR